MDLVSGYGIRRIPRAGNEQKKETATAKPTQSTLESVRRGTIIYDLKQLGRPRGVPLKTRQGSLNGSSIFSLLQKQIQTPVKVSTKTLSTSNTPSRRTCTDYTMATTKKERCSKILPENKNLTTKKSFSSGNNATTMVTKLTTFPVKYLKAFESITIHAIRTGGAGKQKDTKTLPACNKTKSINKPRPKAGETQVVIMTTKIFSKENGKKNKYKVSSLQTKITVPDNTTNDPLKYTTRTGDVLPEAQEKRIATTKSKLPFQKVLNTTKSSGRDTVLLKSGKSLGPTEPDVKTSTDDDNFYVTNNYYDYHTVDFDYNEDQSKLKYDTKLSNDSLIKHKKRELKPQHTFTAKDVAAIEVIVDLLRNSRNPNENDMDVEVNEATNKSSNPHLSTSGQTLSSIQGFSKINDIVSNSIQVHIAIPYNLTNGKKRSANDPVRIRKVFTAKLSTPVDMEYQIHSMEDLETLSSEPNIGTHTTNPTTNPRNRTINTMSTRSENVLPGLYVLEENKNNLGQFILRPVYDSSLWSDSRRQVVTKASVTQKEETATQPNNLARVTLSKDFIAAVDKHLMELYQNLLVTSEHKIKERGIHMNNTIKIKPVITTIHRKEKRQINWESIKNYFGHDKVCRCHCKANHTMCGVCAASDAVISELIFELNNLAQYMNDHCTEIQTYFWINPSGGRKLREAVHRIDKTLYDYYRRVKGKCKSRPCKVFTYLDKRDFVNPDNKKNYIGDLLIRDVEKIADNLEQASELKIGNENLLSTGIKCLDIITKCMHLKPFNKRAGRDDKRLIKNVYSLDNVNVNIICKSDLKSQSLKSTQNNVYSTTTTSTSYFTEPPNIFYYDDPLGYFEKQKKGIKSLLSRKGYSKKKRKDKGRWFTYFVTPSELKMKKRQIDYNDHIRSPLTRKNDDITWYNFVKLIKNKSQLAKGTNNMDNTYNRLHNNDTVKKIHASNIENSSNYKSNVNFHQNNNLVAFAKAFTDIEARLKHNVKKNNKTKVKLAIDKRMEINTTQPNIREKQPLIAHDADDFGLYQDVQTSDVANAKYSLEKTQKINNNGNGSRTQSKEASTRKINNFISMEPGVSVGKISSNIAKITERNLSEKIKGATLQFFDKLEGHNNFLKSQKTAIYAFGMSTISNKHTLTEKKDNVKSFKFNYNKNNVATNQADNATLSQVLERNSFTDDESYNIINKPLKEELDFSSNSEGISVRNNKKELLLSILDFKTNKLNDEWKNIALKQPTEEDVDDDGQSIFPLHSEVLMTSEKSTRTKEDKICNTKETTKNTTSTSPCTTQQIKYKNKTITNRPEQTETDINKKKENVTKVEDICGNCYDIGRDLPEIELTAPPELISSTNKVYDGFLDKFFSKFKFKIVSGSQKEKEAKTHPKGPKGRSLKRKMQHGQHFRVTVPLKTTIVQRDAASDVTDHRTTSTIEDKKRKLTGGNVTTALATPTASTAATPSPPEDSSEKASNESNTTTKCQTKPTAKGDNVKTGEGNGEIYEPRADICDIDATFIHIEKKYRELSKADFKKFVKDITCFKYIKAPRVFQIIATTKTKKSGRRQHVRSNSFSTRWKWNWVRDKRSSKAKNAFGEIAERNEFDFNYVDDDTARKDDFEINDVKGRIHYVLRNEREDYDSLYLGGDGVYRGRESERRKRKTVDMSNVESGLRKLPPLRDLIDEVFVIRGKSVTIYCNVSGVPLYTISNITNMYRYTWSAERKSMLSYPNLAIVGPSLVINNVEPRNFGTYTCCQDKIVTRSVRLNVIEIPDYNIVLTPLYRCLGECNYQDLENIQHLAPVMLKAANCCGEAYAKFRIDQPVCLTNKDSEDLLKPTVVMTVSSPPSIDCDPECRRDLACSMTMLWASNAAALAFVEVVIMYDKFNNSLTPVDGYPPNLTIFKTLKSKDSSGHREYKQLSKSMSPGDVDVVVCCPAGFYLLTEQKICAACPENTCAAAGENTCSACPRGTHSEPGSTACRLGLGRLHRYERQQQYASQLWAGVCGVVCAGCVCVAVMMRTRTTHAAPRPPATHAAHPPAALVGPCGSRTGRARVPRPLSPSRVLLERLFKRSQSSSRATDSQDAKFMLKIDTTEPPPLPPIDFD